MMDILIRVPIRAILNKLFLKSFDTTFIENIKNYQNNSFFFSFPVKKFLKILYKLIHLGHPFTFLY